jgi:hypothetical protein
MIITARVLGLIMKHGTDMIPTAHVSDMSTGTAAPEKEVVTGIVRSILAVSMGSVVVFAGSVVLFAASPALPTDPVFVPSSGLVSVVANTVLGVSMGTVGIAVAVPGLNSLFGQHSSSGP